ncbi:YceD family protein [Pedococcus sp. 5OH_020]|uniref:YceD family protein n=1 Tax=Pedococcus sp. 5OH_020 TaxID=2989814 RepID=UPI0022E9DB67|nr:YceD family protein [Pedococcus sp. 5OH_020]
MDHLNPRSPLVFDTTALGRRPGSMERLRRTVDAPVDFGTDVIAVPQGAPVELELRLESVVEGVLVTGSVTARATGACVRCLDPATHEVVAEFQELFAYADRVAHHREVGDDDSETQEHKLDGVLFDLEPVLVDAVVPALPFQPVCRDDCPGLCSECGARLADDPGHRHDVIDPRWSALTALTADSRTTTLSNTEEKRN